MTHRMLLDLPSQIESDRLLIRPYQPGDGPTLYEVVQRNRDHLLRYESDNVLMEIDSEDNAEVIARLMAADWVSRSAFFLGLWEKSGGAWAGQVYIGPVDWNLPEFEMGYVANVDHEGQGFVSEAVRAVLRCLVFGPLQAHRVSLRCDDANERSIRVAERCGFKREAHLRENKRAPDGSLTGTFVYALLCRDFEALDRQSEL